MLLPLRDTVDTCKERRRKREKEMCVCVCVFSCLNCRTFSPARDENGLLFYFSMAARVESGYCGNDGPLRRYRGMYTLLL